MIEESAQVVSVDGEFAWVQTQRKSACASCPANKGCGTAVLAKVVGTRQSRIRALNRAGAAVGDRVLLGLQESALVRGSLAVYAVPLASLLGGGLFGQFMAGRLGLENSAEGASIACALLGLAGGLLWLRGFTRRIRDDARFQPIILRRLVGSGELVNRLS